MPLETNTLEETSTSVTLGHSYSDPSKPSSTKRKLSDDDVAPTEDKRSREEGTKGKSDVVSPITLHALKANLVDKWQNERLMQLERQVRELKAGKPAQGASSSVLTGSTKTGVGSIDQQSQGILFEQQSKELLEVKAGNSNLKGNIYRIQQKLLNVTNELSSAKNELLQAKLTLARAESIGKIYREKSQATLKLCGDYRKDLNRAQADLNEYKTLYNVSFSQELNLRKENNKLLKQIAHMQEEINQYKQQLERQVGEPAQPIATSPPQPISTSPQNEHDARLLDSILFDEAKMDSFVDSLNQ